VVIVEDITYEEDCAIKCTLPLAASEGFRYLKAGL